MIPLQEDLYAYPYWLMVIAAGFVVGMFTLVRGFRLLRQRTLKLNESNRELNFQQFAFDEHAIISVVDIKGNIIKVNDKFCEISGYTCEELLGQNHRILKSDEHSEEFYKDLWRTITKGKPWHGEIKNIKKDGGYYWVEATIVPFLNKQGKPVEYIGLRTDITARKDVEKEKNEITAQEIRQFKATLDLSQDVIHMFWPETLKFFYCNQAALKFSGCSDEEFYNLTPLDINPTLDEEEFRQKLTDLICSEQNTITYESMHSNSAGDLVPVEILLQFLTPAGEKPRFVSVIRDVSKRKAAERALRQFKITLDSTEDEVYMFWPDSLKFFYINQAAVNQLGWDEEAFFQMTPADIKPEFEETEFRDLIAGLAFGDPRSMTFQTTHERRSGERIAVEVHLQYLEPAHEQPRYVAIVKDITERQKVDKAKAEFVSTVSHELRTPLTAIKGVLGLIKAGVFDESSEKLHSMASIAYNNSDRLHKLIDDLLNLEKLQSGKMHFQKNPSNLNLMVDEAIEANKGYGDEYGVTFTCFHSNDGLLVNADKDRLMQVMANLLSNATKFSECGAKVEVSVLRHEGSIRVSVKDNGSGIPEEAQASIFDRFTQVDSSDQRLHGGTGLGLSIAKMIVEEHGGTIGFTTELGKGSVFYFDLPELEGDTPYQPNLFLGQS